MARGTRGLYQRRSYFYFKYKNEHGQWVERATRTTDSQEAQKIRMSVLREVEDGLLPNSRAKWTLEQAVTQWLSDRKLRVSTGAEVSGMNNGQVNKSELQHIVISELKIRPPVT